MPINPYTLKDSDRSLPAAIFMKFPNYDFLSAEDVENDLSLNEICVASIPNPGNSGFEKCVSIVFKDDHGDVFSVPMYQHHGVLKDTEENRVIEADLSTYEK